MRGYAPYDSTKTCATYATGRTYSYDSAGRLTNYEGTGMTVVRGHSTFPTGAYSSFDNNGNYTALGTSQTLTWDHENRLASISGGTNESYLYDPDGQRVKKSSSAETVYYANRFFEVKNGVATKDYYFGNQRVAMRQGSNPLLYLYSDHLGSTVYTTHDGGTFINEQGYYAYGRYRRGGAIPTDHKFTGQKLDGSGLMYFNARYYNPDSGQFLSPDTIVPDAGNLFDYNRYMYLRGNPMNAVDPSGHFCVPVVNMGTTWQGSTDWDAVQTALDVAGVGDSTPSADGINAVISVTHDNYVDTGLSVIAIVPYLGDPAKGGKSVDEAVAGAQWVGSSR